MHCTIEIRTRGKGLYPCTREVAKWVASTKAETGLLTLFIQHTSASLVIQENADPDVVLATRDFSSEASRQLYEKTLSNIQEVKAREGKVIAVACEGDEEVVKTADHVIPIPSTHELLLPILEVVPLQLLAYHIAVRRGCDVDQPRNLAKSVTVE